MTRRHKGPLNGMFRDSHDGTLSSRRVITFSAFILCAVAFVADLFFDLKLEKFIFDSMSYIAIAGLGSTVAEKFASNPRYNDYDDRYNNQYPPRYQPYEPYQNNNYYQKPRRGTPLPPQQDRPL